MTVQELKQSMKTALEELQRDGIWIREVDLRWSANVEAKDVPKPKTSVECEISFRAEL